jgi:hypothetical protein
MPTAAQAIKAVILCQYLSNTLQPIELFRYNQKQNYIYIIAGDTESIEIIIYQDGNWEFLIDE